jgi:hypothetical protein
MNAKCDLLYGLAVKESHYPPALITKVFQNDSHPRDGKKMLLGNQKTSSTVQVAQQFQTIKIQYCQRKDFFYHTRPASMLVPPLS